MSKKSKRQKKQQNIKLVIVAVVSAVGAIILYSIISSTIAQNTAREEAEKRLWNAVSKTCSATTSNYDISTGRAGSGKTQSSDGLIYINAIVTGREKFLAMTMLADDYVNLKEIEGFDICAPNSSEQQKQLAGEEARSGYHHPDIVADFVKYLQEKGIDGETIISDDGTKLNDKGKDLFAERLMELYKDRIDSFIKRYYK